MCRNVDQYSDAEQTPGILIVRIDAAIYFANQQWIADTILGYEDEAAEPASYSGDGDVKGDVRPTGLKYLILDLTPVGHIDTPGAHMLEDIYLATKKRGVQLVLSNPNYRVMRLLALSGLLKRLSHRWIFVRVHDAVQYCSQQMQENGDAPVVTHKQIST